MNTITDVRFESNAFMETVVRGKIQFEWEVLFRFYDDELNFSRHELMGLTRDQALKLRHKKDVAYFQS